jgi:hypothetical protein
MVAPRSTEGKDAERWIRPPWNEQSPAWREIDAELPANDVARRIEEAVDLFLDLGAMERSYAGRGHRPYPPRPLVKLVLYAKHRGWHRPSEWYDLARDNRVCRWLTRGLRPSRSRWYALAKRIEKYVDGWNAQVLSIAVEAKVTEAARGVQDGTLIAANATRHKLVGEKKIAERAAALCEATAQDEAGKPVESPAWMGKKPRGRRRQLERYKRLSVEMARRQEENAQRPKSERKPREKVRLSPGDPQAPLGLDKQRVFRPLYNVQLIDDCDSPLILAYDAFDQSSDNGTSAPMLARHRRLTGVALQALLADSKYTTPTDVATLAQATVTLYAYTQEQTSAMRKASRAPSAAKQIPKSQFTWLAAEEVYLCPEQKRLVYRATRRRRYAGGLTARATIYACAASECQACKRRPACTSSATRGRELERSEHEPLFEALAARMATPEAQALYRRRQETVELAFADLKTHRKVVRFSGHDLTTARAEVGLSVLAHNILSLLTALRHPLAPAHPP